MDGPGGDLQTKYHKIAGEYSKVRAQLVVLKKAIVEEQGHNVELKEALREKDQCLRKADQEADSLTFRNEQLTRRVTVLQDELDALQNQTKNKKGKSKIAEGQTNSDFTNHLIDEEFRKKIAENAQLLSMMNEKEENHAQEVNHLNSQIHKLQLELDQLKVSSLDTTESYTNIISQLKDELNNVKTGQEQFGQLSQELSQLRRTHSEYEFSTETKLNSLNKIIRDQLSFIDSSNEAFNSLNVNCTGDSKQLEVSGNVFDYLRSALQQLCTTLANWHSHTELRLQSLPTQNSTTNVKYSKHLREMSEIAAELSSLLSWPPTTEGDASIVTVKSMLQQIPDKLASYCSHAETLFIYQRLSVEEEDAEFKIDVLEQTNKEHVEKFSLLVNCIVQLNSHVISATRNKTAQQVVESFQRNKQDLIMMFVSLQEVFKDLFRIYVSKSAIENEQNMRTPELKQANEEITNCLTMLLDSSSNVVQCLHELSKNTETSAVPHTAVTDLKRRAVHYINSLQMDEAPSVSYLDALKDHEDARNSAEMHQVLLQQLAECREQFVKSEQDKEHWKEEYELLKLKLSQDGKLGITNGTEKLSENTETSMLGALVSPVNLEEETEVREQEVKKYFQNRICRLIIEAHEAQSKSATYLSENHALIKRLEISIEAYGKAEQALLEAREKVAQLQEELAITSSNYEAQLSTMSDHLANMNERLAQQKETIDNLEYQIKNNKKGKK